MLREQSKTQKPTPTKHTGIIFCGTPMVPGDRIFGVWLNHPGPSYCLVPDKKWYSLGLSQQWGHIHAALRLTPRWMTGVTEALP